MNHTVAVTSGTRDTGKTTSAAILGAVFPDMGVDVLLVDCDFTGPPLAADLGIAEPDATIRDVFARRATLEQATQPGPASNSRLWLPHPADPFLTPSVSDGRSSASDSHSEDRIEEPDSDAGDNDTPSRTVLVTDGGSDSALDANDSAAEADTTPEEPDEHDGSEIKLTRRGALAAITAAVGGVSAGILSTRETPHIEAFGYGGAPVSSNESGNADATNGTTSAGALPTAGINRTEPTTETGSGDTEPDPSGNGTETGGTGNTTDPASTGNTTETNDELAPGAEPTNGTGDDASSDAGESPTAGGGSGGSTGGSSGGENTADGDGTTGGGDTGTGGDGTGSDDSGDSSEDTTDAPSDPGDEQFGTVGYGEGGYGGVA